MDILIILSLISFVGSQILWLRWTRGTMMTSLAGYQERIDFLKKSNETWENKCDEQESVIIKLTRKGVSDTAFLISSDGIQPVPKNWRSVWDK